MIRSYLERYQRAHGATLLLASHNMAEVERLCSQRADAQARAPGRPGRARRAAARYGRANLEQVFLDIARRPGDETAPRAAE